MADRSSLLRRSYRRALRTAVVGRPPRLRPRGGRLGYGGRIIPAHFHDTREIDGIVADMRGMLPAARELAMEWRWGGPLERTRHGIPWVGVLGKYRNVCCGLGYSGNGVSASNLIGRTLASVVLDLADDYAQSPLVSDPPAYLPPEPIRSAGAQALSQRVGPEGPDAAAPGGDGLTGRSSTPPPRGTAGGAEHLLWRTRRRG